MTLTIETTDPAMADAIAAWTDGAEYELRVRQDSVGKFTALEASPAMVEEIEPVEEAMPAPTGNKNPAIAAMMNRTPA